MHLGQTLNPKIFRLGTWTALDYVLSLIYCVCSRRIVSSTHITKHSKSNSVCINRVYREIYFLIESF